MTPQLLLCIACTLQEARQLKTTIPYLLTYFNQRAWMFWVLIGSAALL